ncbi:hypothetical protein ES705_29986 [subsurface metagenome]
MISLSNGFKPDTMQYRNKKTYRKCNKRRIIIITCLLFGLLTHYGTVPADIVDNPGNTIKGYMIAFPAFTLTHYFWDLSLMQRLCRANTGVILIDLSCHPVII